MARKTVLVSDKSGQEIPEGEGAKVVVTFVDRRRGEVLLDVTNEEAEEIAKGGEKRARRGRKPKDDGAGTPGPMGSGNPLGGGLAPE